MHHGARDLAGGAACRAVDRGALALRMPKAPRVAPEAECISGSPFSPVAARLASHRGPIVPLHIGDTWLPPFAGARMQDLDAETYPGLHRYPDTRGLPGLVEALVEKVRRSNGIACDPEGLLVTAGATGGLAAACGALLSPGDEVVLLAPYWPLIRGVVQAARGTPVDVSFYDRVDSPERAVAAIEARLSSRTAAIYVSTPSNPTGRVIGTPVLEAIAELARRRDLWILSDEVYERILYRGEHVSVGRFAPERTLSVWSFSKAYGMAGHRVGYLAGPRQAVTQARKIATHTFYTAPAAGQVAAQRALADGEAWLEEARQAYARAAERAARTLAVDAPAGSQFLFVDARAALDERGMIGLLEDCGDDGMLVAPGASCGEGYDGWIRVCYTAAPPESVEPALARLARRLVPLRS